jgi:hypothetical protein
VRSAAHDVSGERANIMADLINAGTITLADWDGNLYRIPRALLEHFRIPEITVRLVQRNGHAGPYPQPKA